MYTDNTGTKPFASLPDRFTFTLDQDEWKEQIQEVIHTSGGNTFSWRPARKLPDEDDFFENVWRAYRENGNII